MALDAVPRSEGLRKKKVVNIQSSSFLEMTSLESDPLYLAQLMSVYEHVSCIERNFPVEFVFHGSFGDGHYIKGWSDFDVICCVGSDLLRDQAAFNDFRVSQSQLWELFKAVCPFQHHFISFFVEDLEEAGQVFPIEALSSISSCKPKNYSFLDCEVDTAGILKGLKSRLRSCEEALDERVYKHHCLGSECLNIDLKSGASGLYQLFALLCHVMLLPSLALSAAGRSVHKRASFAHVDKIFSAETTELIGTLSDLRSDWQHLRVGYNNDNSIPACVIERLGRNYFEGILKAHQEAIEFGEGASING